MVVAAYERRSVSLGGVMTVSMARSAGVGLGDTEDQDQDDDQQLPHDAETPD
jgi:hypothetical protein